MNKLLIDIPEQIKGKNITLQMPSAGMGKALHAVITDGYEDYIQWLNWPEALPTEEVVEAECRQHHAEFILRDFIRYVVIENQSNMIIGRCGLPSFQANWTIPQFGISYFIGKKYRHNGYATEAAKLLTVLVFEILKAKKVEIYCDAENIASARVPENLGFELEYMQRGGWPRKDGNLSQLKTYTLFNLDDLK